MKLFFPFFDVKFACLLYIEKIVKWPILTAKNGKKIFITTFLHSTYITYVSMCTVKHELMTTPKYNSDQLSITNAILRSHFELLIHRRPLNNDHLSTRATIQWSQVLCTSKALRNWKIFVKALLKWLQKLMIKTKQLWLLKFFSFVNFND